MTMEFFLLVVAIVIVALGVYLIMFLRKLSQVAEEAGNTLKVLTSDVNVTLYQTNELLAKTNVLVEDVNGKVSTLDPLFTAVADLSVSVSDLNASARDLTVKAKSGVSKTAKAGGVLTALNLFSSMILGQKKKEDK